MVEIVHQPIKQLIVLEVIPYDTPRGMAKAIGVIMRAGQPAILNWAEGIVFVYNPLPPATERLMEKYLEGTAFCSSVVFSSLPEYSPKITIEDPGLGTVEIPILDVTQNRIMKDLAIWLKTFRAAKGG